jgi:hypothetical protein
MLKANEIVPIMPRLTQIERMEFECLKSIIMENGEVKSGVPEIFIRRFEYLLRKNIEIIQAQLN